MPGLSGIELLELLRKRAISSPAIILTGRYDPLLADRMNKAGVAKVLQKPVDATVLLDSIERATAAR
jgi:two-component system C4-dicarboxylate transport response regulator DctD